LFWFVCERRRCPYFEQTLCASEGAAWVDKGRGRRKEVSKFGKARGEFILGAAAGQGPPSSAWLVFRKRAGLVLWRSFQGPQTKFFRSRR